MRPLNAFERGEVILRRIIAGINKINRMCDIMIEDMLYDIVSTAITNLGLEHADVLTSTNQPFTLKVRIGNTKPSTVIHEIERVITDRRPMIRVGRNVRAYFSSADGCIIVYAV